MYKPFYVGRKKMLRKVDPEEVIFISTEGNYTRIYLASKKYHIVRSTLANILTKLPPDMFIQINRSIAASVYYIDNVTKEDLVVGKVRLGIGKTYYQGLMDRLNVIE